MKMPLGETKLAPCSLKATRYFTLVCKCSGSPLSSLSQSWESRHTQQRREGSIPQTSEIYEVCKKGLPINIASTDPPETGTKTSVLSKTVLVAFYWFLWSYLLSRDHFQVASGMRAWKQALLQVPRPIKQPWCHFKGEHWAKAGFSSWKTSLFTLHWLNKFLGRQTGWNSNPLFLKSQT